MAIVRAKIANCPIVLASATPSIETMCNVVSGRFQHIILPERFAGATYPKIQTVDMRHKDKGAVKFISSSLQQALSEKISAHEQSLLFINRRGYAPMMLCHACGERLKCPNCSAWLVEHKQGGYLQCHHCGYTRKIPNECPSCHEKDSLISCGPAVERIYEEAHQLFPTARIEMVSSETMTNPQKFAELSSKILNNEITDILRIIDKIDKQCIIVTKDLLVKDGTTGKSVLNKAKIDDLTCSVYRIQKEDGFDVLDLSTIQTKISKIK